MGNPTGIYGWTFPVEGQDPFYQAFDDFASGVDVTVSSVERVTGTRHTLVLSNAPSGVLSVSSATAVLLPAGDYFTVMSQAPLGRHVGSFSLVRSGAQARLELTTQGRCNGNGTVQTGGGTVAFRCIITGNGMTSLAVPQNSLFWSFTPGVTEVRQHLGWTATVSLGPGAYSCELQCNAQSFTGAGSEWRITTLERTALTVLEVNV